MHSQPHIVSVAQMRAMDRCAIERFGVPGVVLMENAGRAVAAQAFSMIPAEHPTRVCIVAGCGNNGGDGFVAARYLVNRGIDVTVIVAGDIGRMPSDARTFFDVLQEMRVRCVFAGNVTPEERLTIMNGASLIIDALLGTGVSSDVRGIAIDLIGEMNASGRTILAVDVPSGLDADTGKPRGLSVRAARTVTMAAVKKGMMEESSEEYTGDIVIADIGYPATIEEML